MLERGYAQASWDAAITHLFVDEPFDYLNHDDMPSTGIWALTASDVDARTVAFNRKSTLTGEISAALQASKAITAVTKMFGRPPGIESRHIYTVMAYDANTDMVLLRNPWGRNEAPNDGGVIIAGLPQGDSGYLEITYSEFARNFIQVAIEK